MNELNQRLISCSRLFKNNSGLKVYGYRLITINLRLSTYDYRLRTIDYRLFHSNTTAVPATATMSIPPDLPIVS